MTNKLFGQNCESKAPKETSPQTNIVMLSCTMGVPGLFPKTRKGKRQQLHAWHAMASPQRDMHVPQCHVCCHSQGLWKCSHMQMYYSSCQPLGSLKDGSFPTLVVKKGAKCFHTNMQLGDTNWEKKLKTGIYLCALFVGGIEEELEADEELLLLLSLSL